MTLEQTLADQIKLNHAQEGPPGAGATPTCPRDPSSESGLCEPILAQIPPNSIIPVVSASRRRSMRWADVADPTQSCHKKDLQCWASTCPGTHPVVAVVSVKPILAKSPQIQSFQSHLHLGRRLVRR
jgi:hypothetical protein